MKAKRRCGVCGHILNTYVPHSQKYMIDAIDKRCKELLRNLLAILENKP